MVPNLIYVLTSRGENNFASAALLSTLSARIFCPFFRIELLGDEKTIEKLKNQKHSLLDEVDNFCAIDTPTGEAAFINRWIKTQTTKYIKSPCLILDVDTLIRGSLSDLAFQVADLGIVANHNRVDSREQVYPEDVTELQKQGWPGPDAFRPYANGGFLFLHDRPEVKAWMDSWHRLWLEGYRRTGRPQDQPSLNTSLLRSGLRPTWLPDQYNWQVNMALGRAEKAKIWHFYGSSPGMSRLYRELLNKAGDMKIQKIKKILPAIVAAKDPHQSLSLAILRSIFVRFHSMVQKSNRPTD